MILREGFIHPRCLSHFYDFFLHLFPPSSFHTASAGLEIPRKAPWQKNGGGAVRWLPGRVFPWEKTPKNPEK